MTKNGKNKGFSLIELIIAVSILLILGGVLFLNIGVSKRKQADQYSRELCNQIRLMRTVSMSKAGQWRLVLYENVSDGKYYCVQEKADTGSGAGSGGTAWTPVSDEVPMGSVGPITYKNNVALSKDVADGRTVIGEWRFNKDTGACKVGAGSLEIESAGKIKIVTVYETSGRCEETSK